MSAYPFCNCCGKRTTVLGSLKNFSKVCARCFMVLNIEARKTETTPEAVFNRLWGGKW